MALAAAAACALSNVLGDHIVLQRAPQNATVWGFAPAGTTVKTTFEGTTYSVAADAIGTWRQSLPATPASTVGTTITFTCSTGDSFALNDVLFGDVHICGGQSNMQFTTLCSGDQDGYDAPADAAAAAAYPLVRTMTVGETTTSYAPLMQLGAPPTLPWSVASPATIGFGNWSATSAVCWFYGKNLFDATGVPQGLISSNWGGTIIESWSDNATNARCAGAGAAASVELPAGVDGPERFGATAGPTPNTGFGVLFNAMIHPFTVGPTSLKSIIWFQGESNANNATRYACTQPAMIASWRDYFKNPAAFFGFVELEPWLGMGPSLAAFRTAQLAALRLPNVGYAIATDIGDPLGPFGSVHPRNKKVVGARLAAAALSIAYGEPRAWAPPTYRRATASAAGAALTVTVEFDNVPTALVAAADRCKTEPPFNVSAAACAWFSITGSDGAELNATAAVDARAPAALVLTATARAAGVTAVGTAFGMNAWPVNTILSREGLPLQPWRESVAAAQ